MTGRERSWALPAAAIAFVIWLGAALLPWYGTFIDEFYYVACSKRLAWGYVDHPPLSILLLRISRALLGETRFALRAPAALAGALTVWLAVRLAWQLGAGRFGQALTAGAMLASPILSVIFGFYSMNAFEPLTWLLCAVILVRIEQRSEPRLWLPFGLVAGLGLENKHTLVLFLGALAVAVLATPARRHLASVWLWVGAAIGIALVVPNLLWQAAHGWPSIEFYRNADLYKNVPTPPPMVLLQQVLFMNPGTLPIWGAGLVFLLRDRVLRHLGVIYLVLLALMIVGQKSRPDRIAAIYPLLFAAGGAALDAWLRARPRVRWGVPAWLAAWGVALAPLGLPLLPPAIVAPYARVFLGGQQIERGEGKRAALPQYFADRLGWEALVRDVETVVSSLPPEDRARAVIVAPSYGQAGAVEWLGHDLPPVYCAHNSYHLWGPPPDPVEVVIVLGDDDVGIGQAMKQVELAAIYHADWVMPWRNEMPIWVARGPKVTFKDVWPSMKHYE